MSNDVNVICYIPEPNTPWKICLPTTTLHNTVRWYHISLNHIGMTRTYDTLAMHLYHPKSKNVCEGILRSCDSCQRFKLAGRGFSEMPARNPQVALYHMRMTYTFRRITLRGTSVLQCSHLLNTARWYHFSLNHIGMTHTFTLIIPFTLLKLLSSLAELYIPQLSLLAPPFMALSRSRRELSCWTQHDSLFLLLRILSFFVNDAKRSLINNSFGTTQ
jgi:hypothetical protein